MIEIKDKKNCCGCGACVQVCPRGCISMVTDEEGFDYPRVDADRCVDCSLCNRVCPLQHNAAAEAPLKVYAARNRDGETRACSSSGGVFTLLAEEVIRDGGVVFGASFDRDYAPVHTCTGERAGLAAFRGSKYVQSRMGTSYAEVKVLLKAGRRVLFSGTSCQVAGLKRYLGREYDNLLAVEILCHGVPSPRVWQRYLDFRRREYGCRDITSVSFRDKRNGWFGYNVAIDFADGQTYVMPHKKDPYFRGFMKNIYLRPSCYACRCKNGRSGSDMVIADYWCINDVLPGFNDRLGTSMVLVNTQKGQSAFDAIATGMDCVETGYHPLIRRNSGFAESLKRPLRRKLFFARFMEKDRDDVFRFRYGPMDWIKMIIKSL